MFIFIQKNVESIFERKYEKHNDVLHPNNMTIDCASCMEHSILQTISRPKSEGIFAAQQKHKFKNTCFMEYKNLFYLSTNDVKLKHSFEEMYNIGTMDLISAT